MQTIDGSYINPAKLAWLVSTLHTDFRLVTNAVGNLLILSPDGSESLGYIDIGNEMVVLYGWEE